MNKKNKFALISALSLSAIIMVPPISIMSVRIAQNKSIQHQYSFMNKIFNSKSDAIKYGLDLAQKDEGENEVATSWTLKNNNSTKSYSSPDSVINKLSSEIKTYEFVTNKNDLLLNSDGSIVSDDLKDMEFSSNIKTTKVYRGANNSIYYSEKAAKDSYYNIHQIYFFNNLFFRSKNELAVYLEKNIGISKLDVDAIVINCDNNAVSLPIKVSSLKEDLNDKTSPMYKYIEKFIKQNAQSYIDLQDKDGSHIYYNRNELNKIGINKYDPVYTQINSNQGRGNYLVDLDKSDEFDLLGPYYTPSSSDIKKMKDPSLWQKISGRDSKFVDHQLENELVTRFFNTVISSSRTNENGAIFQIDGMQNEIDDYFSMLNKNLPNIYNSILDVYNTMKKGKRYSEFLKLPILFVHTIDQMINYGVDQTYIDKTRYIYNKIAEHYDLILKMAIPHDLLLGKYNVPFSFVNTFKFEDKTLDLNYNIDTIVSNIANDFAPLIKVIKFIGATSGLLIKAPFLKPIDFDKHAFEMISEIKIEDKEVASYKLIWDALSSGGYSTNQEECENYLYNIIQQIYESNNIEHNLYIGIEEIKKEIPALYAETATNSFILNTVLKEVIASSYDQPVDFSPNITSSDEKECYVNVLKNYNFKFVPPTLNTIPNNYNGVNYTPVETINNDFMKSVMFDKEDNIDIELLAILKIIAVNKNINLKTEFGGGTSEHEIIKKEVMQYFNKNILYTSLDNFTNMADKLLNMPLLSLISQAKIFLNIPNYKDIPNNELTQMQAIQKNIFNSDIVIKGYEKIDNFVSATIDAILEHRDSANKAIELLTGEFVQETKRISSKLLSAISVALPFVSIALDVLLNFYKVELSSYMFKSADVQYIWNGGWDESFFFGLFSGRSRGPKDMKLLNPIEVVRANISNGYFYNGSIFNDIDTLRTQQLDDIIKGRYCNNAAKICYSLVDLSKGGNVEDFLKASTIDELVNKTIEKLKTIDLTHPNGWTENEKKIIAISDYTYGNGIEISNSNSLKENINNILSKIKPVWVTQLPLLNQSGMYTNMPITDDNSQFDPSMQPFELPGEYWTSSGGIGTPSGRYQYVMVDPNVSGKTFDDDLIKQKLDTLFYNSFDVPSKSIIGKFINKENFYSELSENINHRQAYVVKDNYGEQKIFLNQNDAITWLMNKYGIYWKCKENFFLSS